MIGKIVKSSWSFFQYKFLLPSAHITSHRCNFVTRSQLNCSWNMDVKRKPGDGPPVNFDTFLIENVKGFLDNIDAVMFDCDGVLWVGNETLLNAQALVIKLRALGKKVFFMTNNSTSTREEFLEKFIKLGFEASVEEIVGTSYLAGLYLKELGFKDKVYVIGTEGITKELANVGIESLPIGPDETPVSLGRWNAKEFEDTELEAGVGAVIVGFDHYFSYLKVLKAASYLSNPDVLFIATNTDEQFPGRGARKLVFPGTGTFVNAVKTAAGRQPTIMGKPETFPFDLVQRHHQLKPERVLMIGDRGNTDILFGRRCGLWTLLVMTGVTKLEEMHKWPESPDPEVRQCVPDYYSNCVNDVYQRILELK